MTEIIVALIAAGGGLIGSLAGMLASNKLTNHRIYELEKKVDKHNHLIERVTVAEQSIKSAWKQIDELKGRG